ncbi:MAG TPA: phosphatidylserine decarboxylase [Rhizomicrobium sp.]|jgi:phosphatidylserine decarboxylase|nr:phosphatidylserine decarboxylase [Rhizomicrobium sp.]
MRIPIHREGWPFIGFAAVLNFLLASLAGVWGMLFLPVLIWVVAFFRDPERKTPAGDRLIICPADGKFLPVVEAEPPAELEMGLEKMTRLSIFMNVFNVHVNRVPCNGTVAKLAYRPGKFFNASFDKASVHNERMGIRLRPDGDFGGDVAVVQIAGLIARRIVCDLKEGERVWRGSRFGIIRFGSRVDIYLPAGANVLVNAGQNVRAGETILAAFPSPSA